MLRTRTRGSVLQEHRGGAADQRSLHSPDQDPPKAPASHRPSCGAGGAGCRVGPGRGACLSTGPFPRTALRTRRARCHAPGSPRGPVSTRRIDRLRWRSVPQYPAWTPGLPIPSRNARIHRRLLPCRRVAAGPLCPFAMCTPLACSDSDGHAATTRHPQPTTRLPAAQRRGGRRRVASHVHHHPVDEGGAQLQLDPGSPRQGYAAALPPGLLTGHYLPAPESPAAAAAGVHC